MKALGFMISLALALGCGHASPAREKRTQAADAGQPPDGVVRAHALSEEAHALFREEGALLWMRWTTGAGALPSSALAAHAGLATPDAARTVAAAAERAPGEGAAGLRLLAQQLATLQISREAGAEVEALERARAQLAFAAPGDARPERSERDLDRLLTEEPSARKRAGIALAEAQAARALAPLLLARDAAQEKALTALGLGSWAQLEERAHGLPLSELAALAERTLVATETATARGVAAASVRNLGITADRLRRADLPRLMRTALADPEFAAGKAWPSVKALVAGLGLELAPSLQVDAEPSPSKGARPLALLVDPPSDVRLSLRPAGGLEEQRATLHEGARAVGGTLTQAPRWEQAQLGDGAAAEGVAQLFEELSGDPAWLRKLTGLRGEPLDDLVHTQATRRLLSARRAAALVLFEIKRREGKLSAPEQAALYRGLVQRATFAVFSDEDASRWALEADLWIRAAAALEGSILAAQLEQSLQQAGQAPWWKSTASGAALKKLWSSGRSLSAPEAARALGLAALDPGVLASLAAERLTYAAPDPPPPAQKPDYKYMQGDKRRRKKHKKKR